MRAGIDIGSNSVRLLIGEVEAGRVRALHEELYITRLGRSQVGGVLSADGKEKTYAALACFEQSLARWQVAEAPIVAATSAVREAADKAEFAAEIKRRFGWELQILAGEEEAAMSYTGAASYVRDGAVVIDVGGGSTELICRNAAGKVIGRSAKVGAVRLHSGEVRLEDLAAMLAPLAELLDGEAGREFVSVGGTSTTLAAMLQGLAAYSREAVAGYRIGVAQIEQLIAKLEPLSPEERLVCYPLLSGREDIIIGAMQIHLELARLLSIKEFVTSPAGLLDGLLLAK